MKLGIHPVYVIIDGIDGCGKTTAIAGVASCLMKRNMISINLHEPTYGKYGKEAIKLIHGDIEPSRHKLYELFTLDRKEHVREKIKPALEFVSVNPSFIVLQDRGYLSAPAYQANDDDEVLKLLQEQIEIAPVPDRYFLIDVDVDVALKRIKDRNSKLSVFDRKAHLEAVRARYLTLAQIENAPFWIIDGSLPAEKIVGKIINLLGIDS